MHRWTDPSATPAELRPCVATFGNFDGVHRGHRAILAALFDAARRHEVPSVAVTFDPHPVEVMHPERAPELIAPQALRDELLADAGVDGLLVLPFTHEFAQTEPDDFIVTTFVTGLQVKALVVGADTKGFGAGYTGDVDLIRALGERHGFEVIVIDDVGDGERWSSSAVRTALRTGDVQAAAEILGRPHRMVGTVVHGFHRGRELGYPTANMSHDSLGLVPADGVYAGWLTRLDLADDAPDRRLPAAISVGTNPTFDGERRTVESYVLDRDDLDLYDETVAVDFVDRIRATLRFDSIEELLDAMSRDVERARAVCGVGY
ncbi:bifunctional riboflavin kinase/FAD synthetase [Janibacter sp. GXQ6167]|uniref:bifunctional riboflavin kinase/FAD synthetase n=1 Tax=Janibacter sp. GXQ6167 TaxID=3240791 RepID=UPI003526978F